MDDLEDVELDIELQDPDDIGSRLVLLSALVLWPTLDASERKQWFTWLKLQEILSVATQWEIDELRSPSEDGDDISREAAEALVPLAWVSGMIGELPFQTDRETVGAILESLPVPQERLEPFLDGLILLDENAVAIERERAEIWRWRATAEVMRRISQGVARVEVQEAIREVVLETAAAGVIHDNDGTDFLVEGAPVRELETAALDNLLLVTDERLRALNWVCGLTEWDQIEITD